LNGAPLRVAETKDLKDSLLVTGFYYDTWTNPDNNLDHFENFTLRTQGVRRLGSAAIDLSYIAAGRFDGYWELRLGPHDLAAGALIVQEAGGVVTDVRGREDYFRPPYSILATNSALHPQMLAVLNGE
jgi:myo-inositol-1(or 4)-monophosphatase